MTTKNKIRLLLFLVAMLPIAFGSCSQTSSKVKYGDGNVVKHTMAINYFDEIDLSGSFNVRLTQGTDLQAVIETDKNLQELVELEVKGNTLYVSTVGDAILRPTRMDLFITYPQLRRFSIGGACKIGSDQVIVSDALTFDISGAAEIDLGIETQVLNTRLSGAGNITLEGSAREHFISLSGASNLQAEKLITETTHIELSGAGSAQVFASEFLKAHLSGVGSIRYHGNPSSTQINKSGLGIIKKAN